MAKQKVRGAGRNANQANLPGKTPMGKNYLLVIGINLYKHHNNLRNAVKDAKSLAALLEKRYIFHEVKSLFNRDATRENIIRTIEGYELKISKNDNLLIFFSGHGYYRKKSKTGYLIPHDAEADTSSGFIENSSLINLLRAIDARHILLVFDSCFSGSILISKDAGMKAVAEAVESIPSRHAMAAANIELASDGIAGSNSPFTKVLLEKLYQNDHHKLPVSHLFIETRMRLKDKGAKQTPIGGSINAHFDFDEGGEFIFYLRNPTYVAALNDLMVFVKGGSYVMGSNDVDASEDEKPPHNVRVSDFYLCKYPVSQGLWEEVMGNNPSYFKKGPLYPVENVSWDEVQIFLEKLRILTGHNYRLPSEAEWEYAAKGGDKSEGFIYAGSNRHLIDIAWYDSNSEKSPHPVGLLKPNELGVFDMSGNICELVSDDWHDDYQDAPTDGSPWLRPSKRMARVYRGGGWQNLARHCRTTSRHLLPLVRDAADNDNNYGLRLARTP